MAKKSAKGSGTIRKKTVTRNGKEYTYWEARITTGRDPGTGKQIQRSFTGKTQKEVREKMQAAAVSVNEGTYTAPQRLTVGQWLDIWQKDYTGRLKPSSVSVYKNSLNNHVKPALGAVRLADLHPHTVQSFINGLTGLSVSSVHVIYKTLHTALQRAVELDYIPRNPADRCVLPKAEQKEIKPLDDEQAAALLAAAKDTPMEPLITVALFTGLRISELLGLTWDVIDFTRGTFSVTKQLTQPKHRKHGLFQSPKSGKPRTITPAPAVMAAFKRQRLAQSDMQIKAFMVWDNPAGLVFTNALGGPLVLGNVEKDFKTLCAVAGLEGVRFHDMRHTYAVNAIRAGDDVKTVQSNMGHATAAFTLDKYGHFTERMKQDSAARMETFMKDVLNL